MEETTKPHRAYQLEIKIGADTREDINEAVWDILRSLETEWKERSIIESASGGVTSGWTLNLQHDIDITHDKYFDAIKQIAENRKKVLADAG